VHLVFDIFQGIGVAAAVGIRPFLPALVVGALAAGNVEIHFNHTDFSFLQSPVFLLVLVVGAIIVSVAERRLSSQRLDRGPAMFVLAAIGVVLGALLFAGSLARGHYAVWPGIVGGAACAVVGIMATRPLLSRVRTRLDAEAAAAVPLYAEATGLLLAVLSVVAPPVGPIALALLLWLLLAARRRGERKYAGLRILR
jgi:FtsH-binding integral membrane protein